MSAKKKHEHCPACGAWVPGIQSLTAQRDSLQDEVNTLRVELRRLMGENEDHRALAIKYERCLGFIRETLTEPVKTEKVAVDSFGRFGIETQKAGGIGIARPLGIETPE